MPRSKHRRKPGGKAVAHPGRGKTRELPLSPEDVLWRRFVDGYTKPFHEKYGDSAAGSAGDMLDLIEEGAFVATGSGRLQVDQGMVEVAGDTITVPARFWSGGQVLP
jgi:hypothetical protein